MKTYIALTALCLFIFTACSTKEVYEPIVKGQEWKNYEETKNLIIDTSSNIALPEDRTVLTQEGPLNIDINTTQRVISHSDHWIISGSIDGNLTLVSQDDSSIVKKINLTKTVAGASVDGNILAILFADNEIAMYDLETKAVLFKEQGGKFLATDSRIVNPYFMNGIILFPTLDGKVVFVNSKLKKRLRTVIVSSEENFNNIISINVVDNKIIAATAYTILSMAQKELRVKYEIRDMVCTKDTIYIATKQGEVIALTPDLQVISKVKFPFAHFYAMKLVNDKLYILEKEGYMIVLETDSFNYTVHDVDIDDGFIFTSDDAFYIEDKKILVK